MASRLVIDGNSVYEIDEDCEKSRQAPAGTEKQTRPGKRMRQQGRENGQKSSGQGL